MSKTELIYDKDSYISSFEAKVVSVAETEWNKQKVLAVCLDKTCFFPEEGGQDSDTGIISVENLAVELNVVHADIRDGVITHFCTCDTKLDDIGSLTGASCKGQINWEERYDKMQQHSGEHIVSGLVNSMFGYNNVGFHLGADEVTMDYDGTFTDEQLILLEKKVNEAVQSDVRCIVTYPTSEELKAINYRSKKELEGQVRIVEFEGYDICACCAPHIKTTGEIGMVKILSAEHFKGGTRMVIKCGMRALESFNELLNSGREISRMLSVKIEKISEGARKIYEDLQKKNYEVIELQNKYVSLLVEQEINNTERKSHLIFVEDFDTNVVRSAVNLLSEKLNGYCACFNGNDEKGYSFILGSKDLDCNVPMAIFRTKYGSKGGGKPSMVQGSIMLDKAAILTEMNSL